MAEDRRAWRLVLESVESDLLSGRLSPGDRLPPERTLAADLGVGRSSVREALRVLEVLGLVRTAVGSGPSSGAVIVSRPSGGMSALLRLQVAAHGFAVNDIVRTRLALEAAVVADLADAVNAASASVDLAAARDLLSAMEAPGLTDAEFLALDQRFHLALAEASGNQVIVATMAGLRDSIEHYVRVGARQLPSWADTSARLMREHRDILAAVESGDATAARATVRQHISGYYAETNLSPRTPELTGQHRDLGLTQP
ncbi:FadR/GntR family transcriptional regulator [Planctomonas deserti]|uniref:FadR/GntR family transcriptional regulator n=1 Tax=Planctomonas deserti TaxID=2144185 RepID=UPI000D37D254|nr:FCD domain-containing protein [Planctomonas deserti]